MEETVFDGLAEEQAQEQSFAEEGFYELYRQQQGYFSEQKKALNTTTLLTTLATMPAGRTDGMGFTEQAIEATKNTLELGNERAIRYQLVTDQMQRQLTQIGRLRQEAANGPDPSAVDTFNAAYNNVLQWHADAKAKTAIEEAAIERIRDMAYSDPVQARVLLDQLENGNADETIRQFNTKLSILQQRAEELDDEYQQSGWGRFLVNTVLNLVPANFNFARTGVIGTAGFFDLFAVGSRQNKESQDLWNMPLNEFAEFADKDGPLMQSIRDNATSIFDLVDDPGAAVEIMDTLMTQTESGQFYNNLWGGVELASVVPWGTLGSATRTLVANGAVKEATRNMDNALRVLDEKGPEVMAKTTGVTEKEITEELSISAVKGHERATVPLSEQVEAHREAARQIAEELFQTPNFPAFFSQEELQNYVLGRVDEIRRQIGSPVKDVHIKPTTLPGGQVSRKLVFTIGKKDGHGFASEGAARAGLRATGRFGTVEREVTQVTIDPKKGKDLTLYHGTNQDIVGDLRASVGGSMGNGLYLSPNPKHASDYAKPFKDKAPKVYPFVVDKAKIYGIDLLGEKMTKDKFHQILDDLDIDKVEFDAWSTDNRNFHYSDIDAVDEAWVEINNFLDWSRRDEFGERLGHLNAEEYINDKLKSKGFEGRAGQVYDHEAVLIFDPATLTSKFEPAVVRDMSGQWFAKIEVDMPASGWLAGKLEPEQQGFVGRMLGRWLSSSARTTDPTLRGMALDAGAYLNRAAAHIDDEIMKNFRKLPKESSTIVRALANVSNIRAKWLNTDEIHHLVERQFGRRANDQELAAYSDWRTANDVDFELRNTAMYLDGLQKGKSTVSFKTRWKQEIEDEDVIVDFNMENLPTDRVYDVSRAKHYVHGRNSLDSKTLKTMKNNGYVMLHMPDGFKLPEGIVVNKLLIKKTDIQIKPLKTNQLNYMPGGHRMYVDRYFVKQGRKGVQPDTGSEYLLAPHTFRTAENIVEGNKWADVMNQARLRVKENRGISAQVLDDEVFKHDKRFPSGQAFLDDVTDERISLNEPFETVYDRDLPSMYQTSGEDLTRLFNEDELGINGYYRTTGRMYTSPKGEILKNTGQVYDDAGEVADILDPFDTLSKSLSQVSRQVGLHTYKMNALERFQNTYKEFMTTDPSMRTPADFLLYSRVNPKVGVEMKNQIEAQREAIKNVLRFEPEAEQMSRQVYQSAAERVLGEGGAARKLAHDAIWWWKDNNPVGSMRGLAFDMKLGLFNPGQLLVQASTMFSATALSPKYGMRGMMGLYPMWHYLLKAGSENSLDLMVKRGTWKHMGFDSADEFKEYARHAYQHGFMKMNGSHILINNYGPNAHFGSFAEKQLRAREHARVFFYTSEVFNRLVAYRIAWGEVKDKGLSAVDPQFNAEILRRADDYAFNMTRESGAWWQNNPWTSIPTQFWAYNARMIEAMFGKRFTLPQRIRLATMQMGLAGFGGIPLVSGINEYVKQKNGKSPDIDSVWGMMDRGFIDYINYQATGTDVLIGERVGTGGWATDTVKAFFGSSEYGEKSMADLLGGATYSIGKSTSKTIWDLAKYAVAESGAQDAGDITAESFVRVLKEISTFGNVSKAMLVHNYGLWKSNKGSVLAADLPDSHAVYAALSFRPAKADEIGYLMAYKQDREDSLNEIAKQLRGWRQEALTTGEYEKYWRKANILMQMVPVQHRREVLKKTNALDDKSFYDYLEQKVADEQAEEQAIERLEE